MLFYKAIKGTDTYEEYGQDLIPSWRVASPEFGNKRRNEIEYVDAEDIAKFIRNNEGYDEMELYACLCDLADMSEEWEIAEDNWGDIVDKAAEKLGVEI